MFRFTLWSSQEIPGNEYTVSAFRKILHCGIENGIIFCEYVVQFRTKRDDKQRIKRWYSSHVEVNGINLRKRFELGFDHNYYDGPHCSLSLGWILIYWCNWNCKKCIP